VTIGNRSTTKEGPTHASKLRNQQGCCAGAAIDCPTRKKKGKKNSIFSGISNPKQKNRRKKRGGGGGGGGKREMKDRCAKGPQAPNEASFICLPQPLRKEGNEFQRTVCRGGKRLPESHRKSREKRGSGGETKIKGGAVWIKKTSINQARNRQICGHTEKSRGGRCRHRNFQNGTRDGARKSRKRVMRRSQLGGHLFAVWTQGGKIRQETRANGEK